MEGIGLAALLLVWVAGNESFGAQLSLTIGGISIQPSEFVKISFVFFVASMFYQSLEFKKHLYHYGSGSTSCGDPGVVKKTWEVR